MPLAARSPLSISAVHVKFVVLSMPYFFGVAIMTLSFVWSNRILGMEAAMMKIAAQSSSSSSLVPPTRPDTVVFYSSVRQTGNERDDKSVLYWKNFYYFLENGISCQEDVIVVVVRDVFDFVNRAIKPWSNLCARYGAKVTVLARENRCYDMESHRLALEHIGNLSNHYQYFFFVNDGVSGPKLDSHSTESWTRSFTGLLNDRVKVAGLSINCRGHPDSFNPHVSSMLYTLDRVSLKIVLSKGAIYDCRYSKGGDDIWDIITNYEIAVSRSVLEAGYSIHGRSQNLTVNFNTTMSECPYSDIWMRTEQYRWWGHLLPFEKAIFLKTSRFVPEDVAKEIGYEGERSFQIDQSFWEAELTAVATGGQSIMRFMGQPRLIIKYIVSSCLTAQKTTRGFRKLARHFAAYLAEAEIEILSHCNETLLEKARREVVLQSRHVRMDVAPTSYESVIASQILQMATELSTSDNKTMEQDVIVFVRQKDFLLSRHAFVIEDYFKTASVHGFGCRSVPAIPPNLPPGVTSSSLFLERSWSRYAAQGSATDMQQWLQGFDPQLPDVVVPVCNGGAFAVRRSQLRRQSLDTWRSLDAHLQSANHIASTYVQRTWAALLRTPLQTTIVKALMNRAVSIYENAQDVDTSMNGMLLFKR